MGGLFVDGFLFGGIVGQGSGIEHFLYAKLRSVVGILLLDLLVAATHHVVIDGHAGTTKLRQDAVGQLAEGGTHIANLLLALLGVFIHRENAQNHLLVLNVRGLHELLETFPVLSRVAGIDGSIHTRFFQRLLYVLLRSVLTLLGQTVVELETALGRGVSSHFHVLHSELFATVGIDFLQQTHKFLHRVVFQLALAQNSLIHKEFHRSIVLLRACALERIGSHAAAGVHHRLLVEFARGNHARSHLHGRHADRLLSELGEEREPHLALLHLGFVVELRLHRVVATQTIGNGLVVAHHFLTLERGGKPLVHLSVTVAQLWNHGHLRIALHVFFREFSVDGGRHFSARRFQRIGRHFKVVSRQRAEF